MCFFLSIAPLAIFLTIVLCRNKVQQDSFKIRFGALYTNMRTDIFSGFSYSVYFIFRRSIYALSIIFLGDHPGIQLFIQILMSLAHLGYTACSMPFEDKTDNIIEMANEAMVLWVLSILLGYTDDMIDPEVGSNIGFLMVGLILFNVFVNALLFIYASGRVIYFKVIRPLRHKLCNRLKKNPYEIANDATNSV